MRVNEYNILVLTLEDWQDAGLTYKQYEHSRIRKQLKASRAALNKPVEVEYESLPERFKEAITAHYGDVYEYVSQSAIRQYLKHDEAAWSYFIRYKRSNGLGLPEKSISKLCEASKWLALAIELEQDKPNRKLAKQFKANSWQAYLNQIKHAKVSLPLSYARFRKLLNSYKANKYAALISAKYGNDNTLKITGKVAEWIISHYALPVKHNAEKIWSMYGAVAGEYGWPQIKDARSIELFLQKPEIKAQWYPGRAGIRQAVAQFAYRLSTELPKFRDSLWYSDGTKLNFYYRDEMGKVRADLVVYEIMDVYSELMLGHAIGHVENSELMFLAAREAVQLSQAKPYQWSYDNQGGHKKLESQDFLGKLARLNVSTQPYNAQSKTIESAFGRFQQYVMRELWFFTGQNVRAKKDDSRANMEFILANKHKLPTKAEAIEAYRACRQRWNHGLHPDGDMLRSDRYKTSVNPEARPLDYLEMVELFWLTTQKPVTYTPSGIILTHKGAKYEFEVLRDGLPDMALINKIRGLRFRIKYDPDNLTHVRLYTETQTNGLAFVCIAEPRLVVPRAIQDHLPGDRKMINDLLDIRKQQKEEFEKMAAKHAPVINPDHTLSPASWQKGESYLTDDEDMDDYTRYL